MTRHTPLRVYLAGPDVFLRDAVAQGVRRKALCAARGLEGLWPFDNEITTALDDVPIDRLIYRANIAMIESCDCGVFNLSAFRGTGVDDGTAFELGYLTALKRPCFGYVNDPYSLRQRIAQNDPVYYDTDAGRWRSCDGYFVEDFGNAHNLMIDNAVAEQGDTLVRVMDAQGLADLHGFESCLDQIVSIYSI